jgi:hypothetical protein
MTNPFLKAEIEAVIEDIQANIDPPESCLKPEKPCSLLFAAYGHHPNDVRRIIKNGLRLDVDRHSSDRTGHCHKGGYSSHD